jgi:cysteine desulfurase/selenocysteine lyase
VKLLAVAHVSNSLGTVNPIRDLARWAHDRDAVIFVDGAQAAPHRPVDVQALECDFYAFSGHKLLGPTGSGVLWGREEILAAMPPFQYGGEMIRQVSTDGTSFNDLPWKFEAGTPAITEVIGLGAALEYLTALGMAAIHEHERELTRYGYDVLSEVPGLRILGPGPGIERGGILSFVMDGVHPHDIASLLDEADVCVRAGHHCTQPLMRRLGVGATARASVYVYNDRADIDRLVAGLHDVRTTFGLG